VAAYPDSTSDVDNLRTLADAALYRAKQAGRNRVEMAGTGG
jgi:GGDEF domain-containing protein